MKKKQLQVWEHPLLHNAPAEMPAVLVIFESHEYDSWVINERQDLFIGKKEEDGTVRKVYWVRAGLFAKVSECEVEDVEKVSDIDPAELLFDNNLPDELPEAYPDTEDGDTRLSAHVHVGPTYSGIERTDAFTDDSPTGATAQITQLPRREPTLLFPPED
jgi:hypothetical protein